MRNLCPACSLANSLFGDLSITVCARAISRFSTSRASSLQSASTAKLFSMQMYVSAISSDLVRSETLSTLSSCSDAAKEAVGLGSHFRRFNGSHWQYARHSCAGFNHECSKPVFVCKLRLADLVVRDKRCIEGSRDSSTRFARASVSARSNWARARSSAEEELLGSSSTSREAIATAVRK